MNTLRVLSCAASLVGLAIPMTAQRPGSSLPPDDPRLYQLFLAFHDNLNSFVQNRKALAPLAGAKTEESVARLLKVDKAELSAVAAVSHQFVLDLSQLQATVKAYADLARQTKRQPDSAVLLQFQQQKDQLINAAVRQLSLTLTPASWAGLKAYINNEHRLHTSVVRFPPQLGTPTTGGRND